MNPEPDVSLSADVEVIDTLFISFGEMGAVFVLGLLAVRWLLLDRSVNAISVAIGVGLYGFGLLWILAVPSSLQVFVIDSQALSWIRGVMFGLIAVVVWRLGGAAFVSKK